MSWYRVKTALVGLKRLAELSDEDKQACIDAYKFFQRMQAGEETDTADETKAVADYYKVLNNLLSVVIGQSRMARDELEPEQPAWHSLGQVIQAGEAAAELSREVDSYQSESDHDRRPVRLQPVVRSTVKLLRDILPDRSDCIYLPQAQGFSQSTAHPLQGVPRAGRASPRTSSA